MHQLDDISSFCWHADKGARPCRVKDNIYLVSVDAVGSNAPDWQCFLTQFVVMSLAIYSLFRIAAKNRIRDNEEFDRVPECLVCDFPIRATS